MEFNLRVETEVTAAEAAVAPAPSISTVNVNFTMNLIEWESISIATIDVYGKYNTNDCVATNKISMDFVRIWSV